MVFKIVPTCRQFSQLFLVCAWIALASFFIFVVNFWVICGKAFHSVNNLVDRFEWEEEDQWNRNVTLDTLREAGFGEEVTFLQDEVIEPFINRDIHAITGNSGAPGLLLYGDMKNAQFFATAIWNEMRLQGDGGHEVAIFRKTELCILTPVTTRYFDWFFTAGVEKQPALIYLHEVKTLSGYEDKIPENLPQQMEKLRNQGVIFIASTPHLQEGYNKNAGFPNVLHVPKLLSLPERKKVLEGWVSAWVRKPGDEILHIMANKTVTLIRTKSDIEEKIGKVCQLAYQTGVEDWKKKNGIVGGGSKIRVEEVNPTLKNWEDALFAILKKLSN